MPQGLWDRPKTGFTPPLGDWLRGPLRDWAEALLSPVVADRDAWLDAGVIAHVWQAHLDRRLDAHAQLWPVLMFLAWRDSVGA